ncbi:MAG: hypothetical protein AB1349_01760 [Elusimicrobiota bacterium]
MDKFTYSLAKNVLEHIGDRDKSILKKYPDIQMVHEIIANHLCLNYSLPEIQQAIRDKAKELTIKG